MNEIDEETVGVRDGLGGIFDAIEESVARTVVEDTSAILSSWKRAALLAR